MIAFEELFRGTIDSASVYPREVLKRALADTVLVDAAWLARLADAGDILPRCQDLPEGARVTLEEMERWYPELVKELDIRATVLDPKWPPDGCYWKPSWATTCAEGLDGRFDAAAVQPQARPPAR